MSVRLKVGAHAPDFDLPDIKGGRVSLSMLRGRLVWLALRRYAVCPFCSCRVHRLVSDQERIRQAGVELVVVFPSSLDLIRKYTARYQPAFRIVADRDLVLYQRYGAEESWAGVARSAARMPSALARSGLGSAAIMNRDASMNRMPCEVLIDAGGTVADILYGDDLEAGMDVERVLAWAQRERAPWTARLT